MAIICLLLLPIREIESMMMTSISPASHASKALIYVAGE